MDTRRFWVSLVCALTLVFAGSGWLVNRYYMDRGIADLGERLLLLSVLRKGALEQYFRTAEAELRFWATNPDLQDKQRFLNEGWRRVVARGDDPREILQRLYVHENPHDEVARRLVDAGDGSPYSAMHADLHPLTELFVVERGYYDFFLISPEGDIYYTVEKESDFATNLFDGEWKDTGLSSAFQRAMDYHARGLDRVAISDMEHYGPSAGAAAMFMVKANQTTDGELLGAIAVQMPMDEIEQIMNYAENLSNTGEIYAVGEDLLMRSNSRFSDVDTILRTRVDTETVALALAGETGFQYAHDYRGVEVLSAYSLAEIDNHHWAVMAEIDRTEAEEIVAGRVPALGGLMLLLYGISLWSLWYGRNTDLQAESVALSDIDFDADIADG